MDAAEESFAARGIRYASIRGDQTPAVRQRNIDEFTEDPDVAVIVCSLSAAGVGVNLQAASNLVRAELRSEEHTSELQSRGHHVCRLLLDKNRKAERQKM